jgi:response regulator RpfG family c-di-GMP phosphodiesterase
LASCGEKETLALLETMKSAPNLFNPWEVLERTLQYTHNLEHSTRNNYREARRLNTRVMEKNKALEERTVELKEEESKVSETLQALKEELNKAMEDLENIKQQREESRKRGRKE